MQLALLPVGHPEVPSWRIWLWSRPANDVGGDLADHLWLSETRLGLAAVYVEQRIEVASGDTVVLYSDGVTEAFDGGGVFFGKAKVSDDLSLVVLERI